jgi:hypothetical protein
MELVNCSAPIITLALGQNYSKRNSRNVWNYKKKKKKKKKERKKEKMLIFRCLRSEAKIKIASKWY